MLNRRLLPTNSHYCGTHIYPDRGGAQHSAKKLHRIGLPLLGDELIPQLDSFAKKAAAS